MKEELSFIRNNIQRKYITLAVDLKRHMKISVQATVKKALKHFSMT